MGLARVLKSIEADDNAVVNLQVTTIVSFLYFTPCTLQTQLQDQRFTSF